MNGLALVTGATGYVGGRLWRLLEADGRWVRCMVRRRAGLASRVGPTTQVVEGDVLKSESLGPALEGCEIAYYLVHSMGSGRDFESQDREAARNFAEAARRAGVRRIIYLGGLGHGASLSPHLRSRHEVGDLLRASGVPVLEFRASIVLGSGSLSFEMIRALVERLPVMVTPRWVEIKSQPIAIDDLLAYLVAALDVSFEGSRVFEIGGADQVSYGDLMGEYARQRGLRRTMIRVPFLTPRLSSLWLGLVTPLYARVGRKLVDSLRNPTVVRDPVALEAFRVRPRGASEAIARALANEDEAFARTRWSDAVSSSGLTERYGGDVVGTRLVDSRMAVVPVSPAAAFAPIRRIGGDTGWYYGNLLWRLRGYLDLLAGGVGLRRGRRRAEDLGPGDALDFWRVESFDPDRLLRLRAEMRVPGRAWLQFEVTPVERGAEIRQTAIFDASGLLGLAYWYALYPFHRVVFAGMLRRIANRARESAAREGSLKSYSLR